MSRRLPTLIFVLAAAGCGSTFDAALPDATPDDSPDPPDAALPACTAADECTDPLLPYCVGGACVACDDDAACTAEAPVCHEVEHACGGCTTSDDCSAYPDRAVCGDDGACRGCVLDGECASEACNFDTGVCYDAAQVVVVAPGGLASGACGSAGQPCGSLGAAAGQVTPSRPIIRMRPGTYGGQNVPAAAVPLVVHAAGARIRATTAADNVGVFTHANTNLTLYDVRIEVVAPTAGTFRAIDVALVARVVLYRSEIELTGAKATGIESEGVLIVDGTTIRATGPAITAYTNNAFQLSHSRIFGGDGVYVGTSTFGIVNNLFAFSQGTAVEIDSSVGAVKRLEFNTFLANGQQVVSGPTELRVTRAEMPGTQRFNAVHNVFSNARPYTGPGGVVLTIAANAQSLLDQPNLPPAADTNLYAPAGLTPEGALTAASPAIDAIADASVPDDLDGDHRPTGAGYDMGADEYVP